MLIPLVAMTLFWGLSCGTFIVKVPPPQDNKASFPIFELPVPQDVAHANYLGVSEPGNFTLTQIKSPVLIIELFSKNCTYCKIAAPLVHQLYLTIQARPELKEKIKIIGIGVNNDASKLDAFREKYYVPFPLFPDKYGAISKKLDLITLPTFIGVKNMGDGTMEKFLVQSGKFQDTNSFLAEIIEKAKLEEG